MKLSFGRGACIVLLCSMHVMHSYIYEIQVLRRWNSTKAEFQYVIGCSDYHDKGHVVNDHQRKEIKRLLQKSDKEKTLVLLEDLSSPNASGASRCGTFFVNSSRGILASLTKECQEMDVDVCNLEYRYCRVIGLCGLLAHPLRSPYQFQPACKIRVSALLDEVTAAFNEIENYQDGLVATWLYRKECAQVKRALYALQLNELKQKSIAFLCHSKVVSRQRLGYIKQLLTFDSPLLDCKLFHTIVTAPKKRAIVALAGGTHITRVCDMLQKVGFKRIGGTSEQLKKYKSIQQAVGLCIGGRPRMKPQPVGLELLRKYVR